MSVVSHHTVQHLQQLAVHYRRVIKRYPADTWSAWILGEIEAELLARLDAGEVR